VAVDGADGDVAGADGDVAGEAVAGEVVVAMFVATDIGRRGALAGGFGDDCGLARLACRQSARATLQPRTLTMWCVVTAAGEPVAFSSSAGAVQDG
jgi:hypothetical protein